METLQSGDPTLTDSQVVCRGGKGTPWDFFQRPSNFTLRNLDRTNQRDHILRICEELDRGDCSIAITS